MKTIKYIIRYSLLTLFAIAFSTTNGQAQLEINNTLNADQLVTLLLGEGVEFSNATLTCPDLASAQFLNGSTTNIGIDNGIILTTGSAEIAIGPNDDSSADLNNNAPGDPDLQNLVTNPTRDACVLEFDFIPNGLQISFNYVFASEEYEEFYCSNFNDVFAFFLSGPNPGGGAYANENIALVPGSSTVVSINNVGPEECDGIDNSAFYINNDAGATIQYDGFLTPFSASAATTPCEVYHIKLAIADVKDFIYDSGVFLETGSFISTNIVASAEIEHVACKGEETGAIDLTVSEGVPPFTYSWSNGETTEDLVGVPAGNYSVDISDCVETITVELTVLEPEETLTATLEDCYPVIFGFGDDNCATLTPTVMGGTGAYSYSWNNGSADASIEVCPEESAVYGVTITDENGCTTEVSTYVEVLDVRCGKKLKKIMVCHVPSGNNSNAHEICVSPNSVNSHLGHGDYLGPCDFIACNNEFTNEIDIQSRDSAINNEDLIAVYPSPASGFVTLQIYIPLSEVKSVKLTNIEGKIISELIQVDKSEIHFNLNNPGIYLLSIQDQNGEIYVKRIMNL